jgi:flagellar biosynthesis/type III secretory pathway chaperone
MQPQHPSHPRQSAQPAGQIWPHWPELEQELAHDERLSQQLADLLTEERASLQQRDYATFERLLTIKQQLIGELEQRQLARRNWLHQRGCPDERCAFLRAERESPALAERWRRLAEQWRNCQQANQVNEQICLRTRVVVGRLLDLLRGEPQGGTTYDASGSARRLDGGRRLGDA